MNKTAERRIKATVGRPVETLHVGDTYALAAFLRENLNDRSGMTNQEIATELGYEKANIVPMWKTGKTRVPMDRLPDIARLMKIDVERLLGLWFEQYVSMHYQHGTAAVDERRRKVDQLAEIFRRVVSESEMKGVEAMRRKTDGVVDLSKAQLDAIAFVSSSHENADKALKAIRGK